jgi:transposase
MDETAADGQLPCHELIARLCAIPGVSVLSAITILAGIGRDPGPCLRRGKLCAGAGYEPLPDGRTPDRLGRAGRCPGQNQSAGKRKSSRLRRGAPWLKTMLMQCAWAATRARKSCYSAQFQRLRSRSRRGPQKAICAVAASLLTPFITW